MSKYITAKFNPDEVEATFKAIRIKRPLYTCVGRLNMAYKIDEQHNNDIVDILTDLSKPARDLFREIKCNTSPFTLLCYMSGWADYMSSTALKNHNKTLKILLNQDMVRKVKAAQATKNVPRGTVMINPYLIQPGVASKDIPRIIEQWELYKS